jgi:hypothetical protein
LEGPIPEITIPPGGRWSEPVDVAAYCWIDKPATYTFEAAADSEIGFLPAILPANAPNPKCTVAFDQPTAEQAKGIFDAAARSDDPATAFLPMREAVYAPLIVSLVDQLKPNELMPVLESSYFPEVTQKLIQIVDWNRGNKAEAAMRELLNRIPLSPYQLNAFVEPFRIPESLQKQLVLQGWREEMVPSLRNAAEKRLGDSDEDTVCEAAEILKVIGPPADALYLASALDRFFGNINPRPYAPVRFPDAALLDTCNELIARGYAPSTNPKTPGEIVFYLEAIKVQPQFRPTGWEDRFVKWSASPWPAIRELTLVNHPPLLGEAISKRLPALLSDPDPAVVEAACDRLKKEKHPAAVPALLTLLGTTENDHLLRSAFEAAIANGSRVDALEVAVNRIDDIHRVALLVDVMEHGGGSRFNGPVDFRAIPGLQKRWRDWLALHRDELTAGKVFHAGDPVLRADLFPTNFQVHLPDGTFWPPRE